MGKTHSGGSLWFRVMCSSGLLGIPITPTSQPGSASDQPCVLLGSPEMLSGGTHRGIPENVGDVSGPDHQLQLYLMVVWGGWCVGGTPRRPSRTLQNVSPSYLMSPAPPSQRKRNVPLKNP